MNYYSIEFEGFKEIETEASCKKEAIERAIEILRCWGYSVTKKMILNAKFIRCIA